MNTLSGNNGDTAGSGKIEANKKIVTAFYEAGLNKKDSDAASKFVDEHCVQHNPQIADGFQASRPSLLSKGDVPEIAWRDQKYLCRGRLCHIARAWGARPRGAGLGDRRHLQSRERKDHRALRGRDPADPGESR